MGTSSRYLRDLINTTLLDTYLLEYKKGKISIEDLIRDYIKLRSNYGKIR